MIIIETKSKRENTTAEDSEIAICLKRVNYMGSTNDLLYELTYSTEALLTQFAICQLDLKDNTVKKEHLDCGNFYTVISKLPIEERKKFVKAYMDIVKEFRERFDDLLNDRLNGVTMLASDIVHEEGNINFLKEVTDSFELSEDFKAMASSLLPEIEKHVKKEESNEDINPNKVS